MDEAKGLAITRRKVNRITRFLVGVVLLPSPIFSGAQDSLVDRLAPAARAAIATVASWANGPTSDA